jgi:hypothetical protein
VRRLRNTARRGEIAATPEREEEADLAVKWDERTAHQSTHAPPHEMEKRNGIRLVGSTLEVSMKIQSSVKHKILASGASDSDPPIDVKGSETRELRAL